MVAGPMGANAAPKQIERPSVLLVDDSDEIREAMGAILGGAGFDVATAWGGEDALRQFREGLQPSVVLLDLMMPVMTGYAVLKRMREDRALAGTTVIVVSAYPEQRKRALEGGATAFFTKPVDFDALIAAVEHYS